MEVKTTIDRQRILQTIARFNREILNPFTLSFAGRPGSPYGIVQHVGRTSAKTYATPVIVKRTGAGFVIPMPYGEGTDWLRNVLAAGEVVVAHQGKAYRMTEPEVIGAAEGVQAFGPLLSLALESGGTESYLRLKSDEEPLDQSVYDDIIADYPIDRAINVAAVVLVVLFLLRRRARRRRRRRRRSRRE